MIIRVILHLRFKIVVEDGIKAKTGIFKWEEENFRGSIKECLDFEDIMRRRYPGKEIQVQMVGNPDISIWI